MSPRVATKILVSALARRAAEQGGFAAILAKGDEVSGSVIVILTERGKDPRILERLLQPDGRYSWQAAGEQAISGLEEVTPFIARRRRIDPDLWILELDVPSPERFTAEMNDLD